MPGNHWLEALVFEHQNRINLFCRKKKEETNIKIQSNYILLIEEISYTMSFLIFSFRKKKKSLAIASDSRCLQLEKLHSPAQVALRTERKLLLGSSTAV